MMRMHKKLCIGAQEMCMDAQKIVQTAPVQTIEETKVTSLN